MPVKFESSRPSYRRTRRTPKPNYAHRRYQNCVVALAYKRQLCIILLCYTYKNIKILWPEIGVATVIPYSINQESAISTIVCICLRNERNALNTAL
jgi:hypothetical protein